MPFFEFFIFQNSVACAWDQYERSYNDGRVWVAMEEKEVKKDSILKRRCLSRLWRGVRGFVPLIIEFLEILLFSSFHCKVDESKSYQAQALGTTENR